MALKVPNEGSSLAVFGNQSELSSATLDAIVAGFRGDGVRVGVMSQCDLVHSGGMEWEVLNGSVRRLGGIFDLPSDQEKRRVTLPDNVGQHDRWDLIYFDTGLGEVSFVEGVAAAQPIIPELTASDQVALWAVFVPSGTSTTSPFPISPASSPLDHRVDHRVMLRELPATNTLPLVNIADYGAQLDGVTDDHDAWVNAFNALPPEGGGLFVPATGGHSINNQGPIVFENKPIYILFANGRSSGLKAGPAFTGGPLLRIQGASAVGEGMGGRLLHCRLENAYFDGSVTREVVDSGSTSTTVKVKNVSWASNEWAGMYVRVDGVFASPAIGQTRLIVSNTSDTLTVRDPWISGRVPQNNDRVRLVPRNSRGLEIKWADNVSMASFYALHCHGPGLSLINIRECQFTEVHVENCGDWGAKGFSGTASSASETTLSDSSASWTQDEWEDYYIYAYEGGNPEHARRVVSNSANSITVGIPWTTTPAGNEKYVIFMPAFVIEPHEEGDGPNNLGFAELDVIDNWGPAILAFGPGTRGCRFYGGFVEGDLSEPPEPIDGSAPRYWPSIILIDVERFHFSAYHASQYWQEYWIRLGGTSLSGHGRNTFDNLTASNGAPNAKGLFIGPSSNWTKVIGGHFLVPNTTGTIGITIAAGATKTIISQETTIVAATKVVNNAAQGETHDLRVIN